MTEYYLTNADTIAVIMYTIGWGMTMGIALYLLFKWWK